MDNGSLWLSESLGQWTPILGGAMSGASDGKGKSGWLTRLAPWLLVGGLVLFHALNNWL